MHTFSTISRDARVSGPQNVRLMKALSLAYVIFPTAQAAAKVLNVLQGKLYLDEGMVDVKMNPSESSRPMGMPAQAVMHSGEFFNSSAQRKFSDQFQSTHNLKDN